MEFFTQWVLGLESTPRAERIAVLFALLSALCHAIFGALQKSKEDPFLIRASIDFWFFTIWLPIAVLLVPWPTSYEWLLIAGVFPVHTLYKLVLTGAYRNGEFTVIYPISRGSSPVFTGLAAGLFFGEFLTQLQWLGIFLISAAIMSMSLDAIRRDKIDAQNLPRALGFALATGFMIMVYSIYDAYGVRESRSPFIFLAWFYIVDGFLFPLIAVIFRKRFLLQTSYRHVLKRGFIAAPFGIVSFSAMFIAARIGHLGEVVAIRETSVIFAAFIGFLFLDEKVTPLRFLLIAFIASGAIFVEMGA